MELIGGKATRQLTGRYGENMSKEQREIIEMSSTIRNTSTCRVVFSTSLRMLGFNKR